MKLFRKVVIYFVVGIVLLLAAGYAIVWRYQDEIMLAVKDEFNEKINGELIVQEMDFAFLADFPNFSFTLVGPKIKDSLYAVHKQYLFQADKVHLQLALLKLFQNELHIKSVVLENASIQLFKDKQGYSNLSVFKKTNTSTDTATSAGAGMKFNLKRIIYRQVGFSYVDSLRNKTVRFQLANAFADLDRKKEVVHIVMKGRANFDQLTFNAKKGSFVKNTRSDIHLRFSYHTPVVKPGARDF